MPQFLVAIQLPDNYDPSLEDEAMLRDIDVLNEEMEAAGARFFAGGLQSAHHAKSLRKQPYDIWSGFWPKAPSSSMAGGHKIYRHPRPGKS